ncbi:MAG: hypothetical protein AABZ53_10860 [Planctomycetota bacterium]
MNLSHACLLLLAGTSQAWAQPEADVPSAAQPAEPRTGPKRLESLDELLGIAGEKPSTARATLSPDASALNQQLSPQEIRDEFDKALALMHQTADRVETGKDVGLETQRMQEEIIRMLDKVLEESRKQEQKQKQQQQQQQQQSGQQNQNASQDPKNGQQQQQERKGQQDKGQETQAGNASGNKDGMQRITGDIKPPPLQGSAAWGNLPAHIRESLTQGFTDNFSAKYRRLTEAYYKRLAEEPKK